jgi:hypothetical protein
MSTLSKAPALRNANKQQTAEERRALRAEQRRVLRLHRSRAATYTTRVSRMRGRLS